jgi:predicted small lipoprotein YifL
MKRIISALLIVAMVACLAACAAKPAEPSETTQPPQATAEPSVEPEQTPEPMPEPTPEREPYTPMDIFSDEFNPAGMDMPTTVFQATFDKDKVEGKSRFVLSMTGSGDMYGCVAFQADVAGLSEDEKHERINEYLEGGYCHIDGTDGRLVDIKQADQNDDRYEYVEADGQHGQNGAGCVIDVAYFMDDADIEKYTQLVRDNYSVDALMPIADFFDTNTDFAECGITVNVYKDEVHAYVVYRLPDVNAVMQEMQGSGDARWWEWDGMMQTVFEYDGVESKLTFDTKGGMITVDQLHAELSAQPAAENSLAALGFGFDDAGTCGVYEQRDPHYISVAIARPEWGDFTDDWNIEFIDTDIKGYSLRITYHAEDGRYHISVDKDGESCAYDCYPEKDQFGWECPDIETVHRMFGDAFDSEGKELYYPALAHFEQFVQDHFSMSVSELYAAPKQ